MAKNITSKFLFVIITIMVIVLSWNISAFGNYKFERMWPALQQSWYFSVPTGMAIDSENFVYISDKSNHCVKKFTTDGHFVTQIGTYGEIHWPKEIAIDNTTGKIYISDSRMNCITILDKDGKEIGLLGTRTESNKDGEFNEQKGIFVDQKGFLYVADEKNSRIQKFDNNQSFQISITKDGYFAPFDLVLDEDGTIYVVDRINHTLWKFNEKGICDESWNVDPQEFLYPSAATIINGAIYVTDAQNNSVKILSKQDGSLIGIWDKNDNGEVMFSHPEGIVSYRDQIDNDYIYVVDSYNHRIQKFMINENFRPIHLYTTNGQENISEKFFYPSDMSISDNGEVYILDTYNNRILKSDSDFKGINTWKNFDKAEGKFYRPMDIAIDSQDNLYVVDCLNHRIQKFDKNGNFIKQWGYNLRYYFDFVDDKKYWDFSKPNGIAITKISGQEIICIADRNNNLVHKFTTDGEHLDQWHVYIPNDLAFDSDGYLYVLSKKITQDEGALSCIHKFDPQGNLQESWENTISPQSLGSAEFIHIDTSDKIYISDSENNIVKIFNMKGDNLETIGSLQDEEIDGFSPEFIELIKSLKNDYNVELAKKYVSYNVQDGSFQSPLGIVTDNNGNIYIADSENHRIQKFNSKKEFVSKWGGAGSNSGEFYDPSGITMDNSGNFYIIDSKNHRVQKFDSSGNFSDEWGSYGEDYYQFKFPTGIVAGTYDTNKECIYVSDTGNNRIQIFTTNGQYLGSWGEFGSVFSEIGSYISASEKQGRFFLPIGINTDAQNRVYIADTFNCRIQVFEAFNPDNPGGKYIDEIKCISDGTTAFSPVCIAVCNDNIYVTGSESHTIHNYSLTEKKWLRQWGPKEFLAPSGIAADKNGYIYVCDTGNHRIQRFDPSKDQTEFSVFGEFGSYPGKFSYPGGLCVTKDGSKVYIADTMNQRIQVFKKWVDDDKETKAIIIAGGGPYAGNAIWNQTQMNANLAYRALLCQGFTKETIRYLRAGDRDDTEEDIKSVDLDGNGVFDDVIPATNKNTEEAITKWGADADSMVVYFIDHGGNETMKINAAETLSAETLDSWMDIAQEKIPGTVTFIYDACYSGSFLPKLTPPDDKNRIVITSASASEEALFVSQGSVSFSNYFWTYIFNGYTIGESFSLTRDAVKYTTWNQSALLDDNGDGEHNDADGKLAQSSYVGNAISIQGDAPVISSVSPARNIPDTENTALLYASVITTTSENDLHVWAVIRPPDYKPVYNSDEGNPIHNMPSVDLYPVDGEPGKYEAEIENLYISGTYYISVYARDKNNNTSFPKQTAITVGDSSKERAVILAGNVNDSSEAGVRQALQVAYEALKFQGFSDENIYYMSHWGDSIGRDAGPTLSNLEYALTTWLSKNTENLVVYIIGKGGEKEFFLDETAGINATELNDYLNNAQKIISGRLTVVYDACQSGSFLEYLIPSEEIKNEGKRRVVITSTESGQAAHFIGKRNISFSKYFWTDIFNGATVKNAFDIAKKSFSTDSSCLKQSPWIDADEDGQFISKKDTKGELTDYYIGLGLMTAGDAPVIGSVCPAQTLTNGKTEAVIWVGDITTTESIDRVWAIINTCELQHPADIPVTDPPVIEMNHTGSGRYEATYDFALGGDHNIQIYARDNKGNISLPINTIVTQNEGCSDTFVIHSESGQNGFITPAGDILVKAGSEHTFTFLPDEGYHVSNVIINKEIIGISVNYIFTSISDNNTISVEFEADNADVDDDGMPAGWEVANGLNPAVNDANEDLDGDGFTNLQEYKAGTDPNISEQPEKTEINVLWYGQSANYNAAIEKLAELAPDYDPNGDGSLKWNLTIWNKDDLLPVFANFDVLVIGTTCFNNGFNTERLLGSKVEIENARGNRTFLSGQDADLHYLLNIPSNNSGPRNFLINAVNWAGSGKGLGIVVMPDGSSNRQSNTWLLHSDSFLKDELEGYTTYYLEENIIIPDDTATFPVNEGLTTSDLSNWGQSAHLEFDKNIPGYTSINDSGRKNNYAVTIVTATEADGGTDGPVTEDSDDFSTSECQVRHLDMTTWTQGGPIANGKWTVTENGSAVFQSINGGPTFFVSPESFINKTIIGRFGVMERKDDDFLGFVFGYKNSDDFYLFSWKQGNQGNKKAGVFLAHVTCGISTLSKNLNYKSFDGYNLLAQNHNITWRDYTIYDFVLAYTENRIQIILANGQFGRGRVIFDIEGNFPEGRFGFYNFSQPNVTYGGLVEKCVSAAGSAGFPVTNTDADGDNMPDAWELLKGLNPDENDASIDSDGDGYTNLQEYDNDTDPNDADSRPGQFEFTAGEFSVEEDGQIRVDYLFDGGQYESELGIFSLSGMQDMEPGSPPFIAEAVRRAMSNSQEGYIVIRDQIEGARFSGKLGSSEEDDWNKGPYRGVKVFEMNPWDNFALILIPDGTFKEYKEGKTSAPLFSLATANPDDGLFYGQIAGISSKFSNFLNAVAIEDTSAKNSDRDYNDLILQIKGVTIHAPTIDGLIANGDMPLENDWRTGQNPVIPHIEVPAPDPYTLWLTITLKSPADLLVYAPDGTFIGKDGGTIPGATLEWDKNGHQVVSLPALSDGDYRIVFRAIGEGGLCRLEVTGYQGDTQIATDEQSFVIEPHQVFSSILSVTEFMENRQIVFTLPAAPFCSCGSLAYDFDADCDIDDQDISRASMRWGVCTDDSDYDAFYDLDENGCIEFYDIMKIANEWITCDE